MDYILEELERQRLAMERLLAAGSAVHQTAAEEEPAAMRYTAAGEEPGAGVYPRSARAQRLARRMGPAAPAGETAGAERRAGEGASSSGGTGMPKTDGMRPAEASTAVPRQVLVRTETSAVRLAAQEISRAVEREARRYDGGFETY